jgi:hypothetical protein
MASPSDLVSTGALKPMGVACTVDVAPSGADGTLDVLYTTDAGEMADEKGLRWASRGGVLPIEGDDALLFLDSLGDPWAIVWPSGVTSDVSARLAALEATKTIRGSISSAGATLHGSGFTSSRTGIGTYVITFSTPFSDVPSVAAMIGNGGGALQVARQTAISASSVTFNVRTQDVSNNSSDQPLDFIAEGPS